MRQRDGFGTLMAVNHGVRAVLRERTDLRKRGQPDHHPLAGHCYVACEALWHALGRPPYLRPHVLRLASGGTHWFLKANALIVDPTREQFDAEPDYDRGRCCGFLTKKPSKRAQIVLDTLRERGIVQVPDK